MNPELTSLLARPAMILVAVADGGGRAIAGRGMALTATGDASLEFFVSRRQWPDVVDRLVPGAACAITANDPDTYRTFQLKGVVEDRRPSTGMEAERVDRYVAAISGVLAGLGIPPHQIQCWFTRSDTVRISMGVSAVYSQTPGPTAGARVEAA